MFRTQNTKFSVGVKTRITHREQVNSGLTLQGLRSKLIANPLRGCLQLPTFLQISHFSHVFVVEVEVAVVVVVVVVVVVGGGGGEGGGVAAALLLLLVVVVVLKKAQLAHYRSAQTLWSQESWVSQNF